MFEIKVPATSANLGPGFDCLGFAINLYNTFKLERINSGFEAVIYDQITGQELELSLEDNLFYYAMEKIYKSKDKKLDGIRLTEYINIPFARGLGSSATAVVAGLLSANIFLDQPYSEDELIDMAVEMEGHPDNVLPALKGGFIINVMTEKGLIYKKIDLSQDLKLVIVIPDFKLKTDDVRKVLPDKVNFKDAIFNSSRTALLTSCIHDNDFRKLRFAMEDKLHQDYRSELIPGFHHVIDSAYKKGALGVALSGAGPSILAIVKEDASSIGQEMVNTFSDYNIKSNYIIKHPDNNGYLIVK